MVACSTSETEPLPTELTLDQILERTRESMSDVTSYKTEGEFTWLYDGEDGYTITGPMTSAWQAPNDYMSVQEALDPREPDLGVQTVQFRHVRGRTFAALDTSGAWQEIPRIEGQGPQPIGHIQIIDSISNSNTAPAMRFENREGAELVFIEYEGGGVTTGGHFDRFETLVVDTETWRFVDHTIRDVAKVLTSSTLNGQRQSLSATSDQTFTSTYYDYNVPNEIDAPIP